MKMKAEKAQSSECIRISRNTFDSNDCCREFGGVGFGEELIIYRFAFSHS